MVNDQEKGKGNEEMHVLLQVQVHGRKLEKCLATAVSIEIQVIAAKTAGEHAIEFIITVMSISERVVNHYIQTINRINKNTNKLPCNTNKHMHMQSEKRHKQATCKTNEFKHAGDTRI